MTEIFFSRTTEDIQGSENMTEFGSLLLDCSQSYQTTQVQTKIDNTD